MLASSALFSAVTVLAASEEQPHYHNGKLQPYKMGPPSLLLSAADEAKLRSGQAVMQALVGDDGSRRMISVQDIEAPAQVVMGCAQASPSRRAPALTTQLTGRARTAQQTRRRLGKVRPDGAGRRQLRQLREPR